MRIAQPIGGYRYSVDAFWLAGFALELVPEGSALDLCTGSGIVAQLLAAHGLESRGVDVQAEWEPFWKASSADRRPDLWVADARELHAPADLITCNPPYRPAAAGPLAAGALKSAAHAELHGSLVEIWQAAERCRLRWTVFVVPTDRVLELPRATRRIDIGKKRSLLAWGTGESSHLKVTEAEAESWVRAARRA